MPPFDEDDKLAARRIAAAILDLCCQATLVAGLGLSHELNWFPWRYDDVVDLVMLCVPLIYSAIGMWLSSSPAQWMLGLVILDVGGQLPRWGTRVLRAGILKSPYLLFMVLLIGGVFLPIDVPKAIAGGFFAAIVGIMISFFGAEQSIELGKLPYYDRWLKTRVVYRPKVTHARGFPVMMQEPTHES